MLNKKYVPQFVVSLAKYAAYQLYRVTGRTLQPPFDKYDFETFEIIRKVLKKDSNCIDVGAHKGEILRRIVKAAPAGQHYAFEPIPYLFKQLQHDFGNSIHLNNIALSNEAGEVEFSFVKNRPAVSGFKARDFDNRVYEKEMIRVKTERIDDIIPASLPITLIKIDVEGAELMVLQGARQTLLRNKPVVLFEFGLGGGEMYGVTPEMMYDFFEQQSMKLTTQKFFLEGKVPLDKAVFCEHYYKGLNYFFMAYDPGKSGS